MACDIKILRTCASEREAIVAYLVDSLGSPMAAADFLASFDEEVARVAELPESFPYAKDQVLELLGYRFFLVKNYIVLYKIVDETICLAHIFHQTQNYANLVVD